MKELVLRRVLDLSGAVGRRSILAAGVGGDGHAVLLLGSAGGRSGLAARLLRLGDTTKAATAALVADTSGDVTEQPVDDLSVTFPRVQLLPDGRLLVVESRVPVGGPANAHVMGLDGAVDRSLMFGDGIEHVLVDASGRAWVGYFDEGVFGNLGWGDADGPAPIGMPGLVRFDIERGEPDWRFEAPDGSRDIYDCYALNVVGDTAWAYYYDAFDLVRVDAAAKISRWRTPVAGAKVVAADENRALLIGSYEDHQAASLWTLGDGELVGEERVHVRLEGTPDLRGDISARGAWIHAFDGAVWFAGSLDQIP